MTGAALFLAAGGARAQVLYDGKLGTLPADQGWTYVPLRGTATQAFHDHATRLSTVAQRAEQAGYAQTSPVPLQRSEAFTVRFTVQIHSEAHVSDSRAGFSLLVLGADQRGIELGFWTNAVFAQGDRPFFTREETSTHVGTDQFTDYGLTLRATNYILRAHGAVLLTGPIRDYTGFVGLIDPYETANLVFLGDNTTSAQAEVSLRSIILVPAPRLESASADRIRWSGVPGVAYAVETSGDLIAWAPAGTITSADSWFVFSPRLTGHASFVRVSEP